MTKKLSYLALILTALFWPLSFVLANPQSYFHFLPPALLVALLLLFFHSRPLIIGAALILLSLFYPQYLLIAPLFLLFFSFSKPRRGLPLLTVSLFVLGFRFSQFHSVSNLKVDYQSLQQVLGNINLYPSTWYARLMQNKLKIVTDKILANLFALLDPNNYFFSFHPRELRVNQSLIKFPFASLPFLLFGLYHLFTHPFKKSLKFLLPALLLGLSFLANFDRFDLVLYPLLLGLIVHGFYKFRRRFPKIFLFYLFFFFLFTIPQLIRLLAIYA